MTNRILPSLLLLLLVTGIGGCARHQLAATVVLSHGNCQGAADGVAEVSFADVARLRGSTLLSMTAPEAGPATDEPDLLLVSISRGRQPTPGYALTLEGASLRDRTATLSLDWQTPDPSAVLAQVVTRPCLVVGMERHGIERVRAVDQHGEVLGELAL
jgi:hypothetical protein